MSAQTPGCTCTVVHDPDGPEMGSWIRYCPVHAAAPRLLPALLVVVERAEKTHGAWNPDGPTIERCRAAIAKARGA